MKTTITRDDVAAQFNRTSHLYAQSRTHAAGVDLDLLVAMLDPQPTWRVLDIATGAGNTAAAIAPFVRSVVAADIADNMLARTRELFAKRGITNATTRWMPSEALDATDGSFDAVVCRIAAHHFLDVPGFLREVARVLRPGGRFVIEDNSSPDDRALAAYRDHFEAVRDPSHVHNGTPSEWLQSIAEAGLTVERVEGYALVRDVEDWIGRSALDDAQRAAVHRAFIDSPAEHKAAFDIVERDGHAVSYRDDKLLIAARKPRNAPARSGG